VIEERDAYGRRRSSRSIRTGVGSRGGIGHRHSDDPAAWAARCRAWRAAHPEYRERERVRRAEQRRRAILDRDRAEVDAEVARMATAEDPRPAMHQLDVIATRAQYLAHLQPVLDALPEQVWPPVSGTAGAVLVSSAQDLGAALRARYRRIAYMEHGIGQSYGRPGGYPGGVGRQHVNLFLSPNEHAASADRRAYPGARVELVGDPVAEVLSGRAPAQSGRGGRPTIAVSFHWECPAAPESRSALPHYRRALAGLAREHHVIGHGHPRAGLEPLWRELGIEWVPSWEEVLERADLYVADNTSTLYEFALTDRPVLVLNAPWYRRSIEHGLRFWHDAGVGVQVDEPEELLAGIERALADEPEQQAARAAALRCVYPRRAGIAATAAEVLEEWLSAS